MKISKARRAELYAAIAAPITDMRIQLLRLSSNNSLDDKLFKLEKQIWKNVKEVLNLEDS